MYLVMLDHGGHLGCHILLNTLSEMSQTAIKYSDSFIGMFFCLIVSNLVTSLGLITRRPPIIIYKLWFWRPSWILSLLHKCPTLISWHHSDSSSAVPTYLETAKKPLSITKQGSMASSSD